MSQPHTPSTVCKVNWWMVHLLLSQVPSSLWWSGLRSRLPRVWLRRQCLSWSHGRVPWLLLCGGHRAARHNRETQDRTPNWSKHPFQGFTCHFINVSSHRTRGEKAQWGFHVCRCWLCAAPQAPLNMLRHSHACRIVVYDSRSGMAMNPRSGCAGLWATLGTVPPGKGTRQSHDAGASTRGWSLSFPPATLSRRHAIALHLELVTSPRPSTRSHRQDDGRIRHTATG